MAGRTRDEIYMRQALELALRARGRTRPNPMVGAVLVKEGRVIAEGYHRQAGMPHAEIEALRAAGERARGATLYVNLEPCCHVGRTGPCTEAIIAAGVKRVVVAMEDPNPLVAGKGVKTLREAGIEVQVGVLEPEARRLNEAFIKYITTRTPFVVLKVAMTLDGKIATRSGASRWITGAEARAYVHQLRATYDAILVGKGTVLQDDPSLTARLPGGRDPVRIALDSRAELSLTHRLFRLDSPAPTWVAVTERASSERLKMLRDQGVEVLVCGPGPRVDLRLLLQELGKREITSLLVEGGATVNASFLDGRLVDKVVWLVAPKIFGGLSAPSPVAGEGVPAPEAAWRLRELTVRRLGEDFCFEGYLDGVKGD
ncbi:bifunctional diaminohydroxyphosphoribosylaminopyrimidine deaminase/5-amino-6-(5-phosphoribosylamino)uracil reductase RibD [Desulfothermobacter acidiphilus]|uniref:bifunctional diaminohydroxyphosphoribosylaminopyrimidine deaminase/5-amino-6-(5-phosphoribosylamino)uracil reductase RibD n=1 Tax=Desulfothermobacter acidiphilus TaxID=1938353 RepID=UPI003F8A9614